MKDNQQKIIQPDVVYTPSSLGEVLERSEKWIKENMIYNNECRHFQRNKLYLIYGKWVIEWMLYDHNHPEKDE